MSPPAPLLLPPVILGTTGSIFREDKSYLWEWRRTSASLQKLSSLQKLERKQLQVFAVGIPTACKY
jgi:hypothetical protein